ncbi:hypothetical protein BDM02DRAFT_3186204 [Thelephora ganbajun]|uniref:Uncharacterized protein n=1 Tax=Thelephora ganbajun TaxID=370292 RepID=A0ACB6ZJ65_THEGA|nr:hypothetical protein BDM02DRAFT_3186204 [Thelephora ganbajun]
MAVKGTYPSPVVEDLDPLASLAAPPKNETKLERFRREQQELSAKRVSDRIDEDLNGEKAKVAAHNPSRKQVRVLVLGHRASGKSTIIKQIQLTYAPCAARCFWTSVVQLNLMQNISDILGIIGQGMATQSSSFSQTHFSLEFIRKYSTISLQLNFLNATRTQLSRQLSGTIGVSDDSDIKLPDKQTNEEIGAVLSGFINVVKMLWDDETVQKTLSASLKWQEVVLSSRGFFLEDMARIAVKDYQATDDDIMRACLRRSGVKEYRMVFEKDRFEGTEWIMYSFDSTRSTKLAWASFFERLDAVFFVAPLDCFDEWSDDNENELKHSMDLWGGVVRNKMLCRTPLVLIHNKINLLREKLEAGTKVVDHVVSFKDKSNDVETVIQYFRHYFKQIYRSSTNSNKALKNLTSKLQSVGSTSPEPQEDSPVDPPERFFKAYVAHADARLVKSLVSFIPDTPVSEPPKAAKGV